MTRPKRLKGKNKMCGVKMQKRTNAKWKHAES